MPHDVRLRGPDRAWPIGMSAIVRRSAAVLVIITLLGTSCRSEGPDDLEYLVWEVCRQVRSEGVTTHQVSGILLDASRHGAVMDRIEAECGDEIASVFER